MQGLIGKKLGMTRVFDDQGAQLPVTVIECGPCLVVQCKTKAVDGYDAVQVGFGEKKEQRTNKPDLGRFRKAGVTPKLSLCEFALDEGETLKAGDAVSASIFDGIPYVDISGVTKGKGFQGVVRRHSMSGGPMTHGGHSKRRIGAIGARETPGKIHKGKRMPGHMGHVRMTQQNLKVVQVRAQENVLVVKGAVPGPAGALVVVRKSLKKGLKKKSGKA